MKIAVMGAGGRMGRELVKAVLSTNGATLSGATEMAGSPFLGQDAGSLAGHTTATGIRLSSDLDAVLKASDAIIDFTAPAASVALARKCADLKKIHIIGTTGCSAADEAAITAAGQSTTIVKAGNMSLGVNLLTALVRKVAAALDEDFDIEVLEMHHRMKVDAPSGTALMLGEAAAEGRKAKLASIAQRVRDGHTGARKRGDIGFATLRGGSVIGEHTVMFSSDSERIEITHKASDRSLFAKGAVKAALWAKDKPPGRYDMLDVLGLKTF
jgi:4-hydroxy-tetrahydrodipicolinate reductase